MEKYNARLVVCGNEEGDNNNDCFSPVIDDTTIKPQLCLAVEMDGWWNTLTFKLPSQTGN